MAIAEFTGKKVLVTGSAKGLGRQIALDFARQGAILTVNYRKSKEDVRTTASACSKFGHEAFVVQADVTKPVEAKRLVETAAKRMGGLDILVNNVGAYLNKPLAQTTPREWMGMLDSNLNSAFYCTQAALPIMRKAKNGRIINIGFASCGKIEARPNTAAYAIAKTGALVLTKTVALAEAANGITCNMVSPGNMERSVVSMKVPAGRDATLEEVSRAVLFFAQKGSGYVTGQNLEVAGGLRL